MPREFIGPGGTRFDVYEPTDDYEHDVPPASSEDDYGTSRPQRPNGSNLNGDRPPEFTDEALALRFADLHANDLRYVATWGRWLHWSGTHWRLDETLQAFDFAREVCREAAAALSIKKAKLASVIASAKTVAAIERLAKADRRLAATSDQWDANPWLLNTPGGALNLMTGKVRPHNPSDHCTKSTTVSPSGDCPVWLAFLARVTGSDVDLQAFLQRMFGYALTGDTTAHALFFLFGYGANGKSVAIDTASGIMGDYHQTAPIDTFTHSTGERHPTELPACEARGWSQRLKQRKGDAGLNRESRR